MRGSTRAAMLAALGIASFAGVRQQRPTPIDGATRMVSYTASNSNRAPAQPASQTPIPAQAFIASRRRFRAARPGHPPIWIGRLRDSGYSTRPASRRAGRRR